MGKFNGKVAIITGAGSARGMGRTVALAFAREGASIVVTDINAAGVEEVAAEVSRIGPASGVAADVSLRSDVERLAAGAVEKFGGIDILVNCAGIIGKATKFLDISDIEYDKVLDINLKGTFLTCQVVVPYMLERKGGAIVNIASLAGQKGGGGLGSIHYSASKAGVMGLTKALAREFTPKGIRVNCITPGLIETEMMHDLPPERKAGAIKEILVGRAGTPQDIANGVLFLASPESSYLTGLVLDINGGLFLH